MNDVIWSLLSPYPCCCAVVSQHLVYIIMHPLEGPAVIKNVNKYLFFFSLQKGIVNTSLFVCFNDVTIRDLFWNKNVNIIWLLFGPHKLEKCTWNINGVDITTYDCIQNWIFSIKCHTMKWFQSHTKIVNILWVDSLKSMEDPQIEEYKNPNLLVLTPCALVQFGVLFCDQIVFYMCFL